MYLLKIINFNTVTNMLTFIFILDDLLKRFRQCRPKFLITTIEQGKRIQDLMHQTVSIMPYITNH